LSSDAARWSSRACAANQHRKWCAECREPRQNATGVRVQHQGQAGQRGAALGQAPQAYAGSPEPAHRISAQVVLFLWQDDC
jgi:hypothetical protein